MTSKPQSKPKYTVTVGTHNTEDENGLPTFFASAILFTEAVPERIRDRARVLYRRARREAKAKKVGYNVVVHGANKSLAVALRRDMWEVIRYDYRRAHEGVAKVTPGRGTLVVVARHIPSGELVVFLCEHRINAAFPPFKRGEPEQRKGFWGKHSALTQALIAHHEGLGRFVIAGGDENTPDSVLAFAKKLHEVGRGYDRLGCSKSGQLDEVKHLDAMGSDHRRLVAQVTLPWRK